PPRTWSRSPHWTAALVTGATRPLRTSVCRSSPTTDLRADVPHLKLLVDPDMKGRRIDEQLRLGGLTGPVGRNRPAGLVGRVWWAGSGTLSGQTQLGSSMCSRQNQYGTHWLDQIGQ